MDLARDTDVEEVDFPVGCEECTSWGEGHGGVVELFGGGVELGDGATDEVDFVCGGEGGEGVVGGGGVGVCRGWGGLGVVGEMFSSVGGVEAFLFGYANSATGEAGGAGRGGRGGGDSRAERRRLHLC